MQHPSTILPECHYRRAKRMRRPPWDRGCGYALRQPPPSIFLSGFDINAKKVVNDTFGKVDILVNGAGGNHPKGTTTKEYFEKGDIENPNVVSFFD